MTDKVRFSYHVDPSSRGRDRGRVVTIARTLEGNDVLFGFAVCKPTYWVVHDEPQKGDDTCLMHKVEGDRFTKKQGRLLSKGRLEKRPWRAPRMVTAGEAEPTEVEHPMDAIQRFFTEGNVTLRDEDGNEIPCPEFILRTVAYNEWDVLPMTMIHLDGEIKNLAQAATEIAKAEDGNKVAEHTGT